MDMTFKELMENYKNGTATPEERKQVEQELEKYETISQHYMNEIPLEEEEPEKNEAEWKKIRGKLKKRNILLAVFILLAVIIVSWGSIAINAEHYLSKLWYDPNENHLGSEFATDLELALEAATELYMPSVRTESVISERTGVGRYDLSIQQWDNSENEIRYCFGNVERNRITLNRDFYQYASANAFENSDPYNEGIQTPKDEIMAKVGMLPEYVRCKTYISFGKDVSMEMLAEILEKYDLYAYWAGVRVAEQDRQIYPLTGFDPSGAGYIRAAVEEKYPYYEIGEHRKEDMGMVFEEHFKSLLRLAMDENIYPKLNQVGFNDVSEHQEYLDYVEENGVKTYGFVASLTREQIAQLATEEVISGFYIDDLQLEIPWE